MVAALQALKWWLTEIECLLNAASVIARMLVPGRVATTVSPLKSAHEMELRADQGWLWCATP